MYKEREITKLSPLTKNGFKWKRYLIKATKETNYKDLVDATNCIEDNFFENVHVEHNIGFIIIHAGADMDFVLFGYWINTNELVLKVYKAPPGQNGLLERADINNSSIACVWDLRVISFERDSWVKYILSPNTPDVSSYWDDQLETII